MDLRIVRTKESIRQALIDLIEEKGFEAITVKDITTKAKINRGTFYSHYQDKYDLIDKCREEIQFHMSNIIKQNVSVEPGSYVTQVAPVAISIAIFEYLDINRKFMRALLKGDLTFQTKMKEFMWQTLFVNKSFPLIKQENLLVPSEYLIAYLASAHMGVIEQWLNSERKVSPQEMAHILFTMTVKGPFTAAGLKS